MKTSHLFKQTLLSFYPMRKFPWDCYLSPFDYFKEFAVHQIETLLFFQKVKPPIYLRIPKYFKIAPQLYFAILKEDQFCHSKFAIKNLS